MNKLLLLFAAPLIISSPSASAATPCNPVPGTAALWSNTAIRWVWVGETHGTVETPAVFGDMVCDALAHGRQVTVGLERPMTEQAAIDAVVGGGDRKTAEQEMIDQPDWRNIYDGRTSQAMLDLLFRLRDLKAQYPAMKVATIVDLSSFTAATAASAARGGADEQMGQTVLALDGKQPKDLVLVLSGNVHGLQNPIFGYKTAAMYLPADKVVTLEVTDGGGQAWMRTAKGCGVFPGGVADKDRNRAFGVYLDPGLARVGTVSGILALGRPVTASPPANTAALATTACRVDFLSNQSKQPAK